MAGITGRNPFIGNYPASYAPSMTGYQQPGYWPQYQAPQMMQPGQQPGQAAGNPQMTLPTVHADILQVADEEAMTKQPVDAGTSQMMITKDESTIGVKSVLANGESTLDIWRRIPKAEKPAEPEYITREEFEKRMAEMIRKEKARPMLRVLEPEEPEIPYTEAAEDEEPPQRTVQRRTTGGAKRG